MEQFLEILKYTIPGLVVFATAYHVLKLFLEDKYNFQAMTQKHDSLKITLPLKIQAYERLSLLCDRLEIQNLLFRLRAPEMTVGGLKTALSIGIQQEFDHNAAAQIYVSETLWKIMKLAKNEQLSLVMNAADGLDNQAPDSLLVDRIFQLMEEMGTTSAMQTAQAAIRAEVGSVI